MTIGEKIKAFRLYRGMSQNQLADACGIISATIRKYELGIRNPKPDQLKKIAAGLQVSDSVFYEFEISTAGEVAALLFMLDNAIDMELFETEDNVALKFKDGFLKKFMREWFAAKNKTAEIKSDANKVDNDEAKTAIEDKANEYYNSYKTAALDNPAVVKKGTEGIVIKNYAAFLDEE